MICSRWGKSLNSTISDETKGFTLRYIDWQNPRNNVFDVAAEFEVERTGSRETRRPDIVCFVNGIPFVVIECKRPDSKDSLEEAIKQNIRNWQTEEIPQLFLYSQLALALNKNDGSYATTGASLKFRAKWKGTGFNGQLTAPGKREALLLRGFFDQFGKVKTEVIISGPGEIENAEEHQTAEKDESVELFWEAMMAKYGTEKEYNRRTIDAFKRSRRRWKKPRSSTANFPPSSSEPSTTTRPSASAKRSISPR